MIILAYGLSYLKRLRRAFDQTEIRTVTGSDAERIVKAYRGSDAERIVKAYRTEEGYLQRRSRVWLLMIAVEAAVVLITAGGYIYATNKDRWALEAEQRRIERAERERQEALKAEVEKQKAEAEAEQRRIEKAECERLEALIAEVEKQKAEAEAERERLEALIADAGRRTTEAEEYLPNHKESLKEGVLVSAIMLSVSGISFLIGGILQLGKIRESSGTPTKTRIIIGVVPGILLIFLACFCMVRYFSLS